MNYKLKKVTATEFKNSFAATESHLSYGNHLAKTNAGTKHPGRKYSVKKVRLLKLKVVNLQIENRH